MEVNSSWQYHFLNDVKQVVETAKESWVECLF